MGFGELELVLPQALGSAPVPVHRERPPGAPTGGGRAQIERASRRACALFCVRTTALHGEVWVFGGGVNLKNNTAPPPFFFFFYQRDEFIHNSRDLQFRPRKLWHKLD